MSSERNLPARPKSLSSLHTTRVMRHNREEENPAFTGKYRKYLKKDL